jgi:ABC-type transport system involved in cytochrome bd biosynthesis fused ATPase/permease subunit
MKKFNLFLAEHGIKILLVFMLLSYMKSCSIDSEVEKIKKDFRAQKEVIDALPNRTDLRIEGLKVEKRMIQATDRKMLDVQRQNAIEKEIADLQDTTK